MKTPSVACAVLLLLGITSRAWGVPRYPDTSALPAHLIPYYESDVNKTKVRLDVFPRANLGEDGTTRYRYDIHLREGLQDLDFWKIGFLPNDTVLIGFGRYEVPEDWFLDARLEWTDLYLASWWWKTIRLGWIGGTGGMPTPGGSAGPFVVYAHALPGIVPLFYTGERDPIGNSPPWLTYEDGQHFMNDLGPYSAFVFDSTVGPGVIPEELSLEQHLFRLQELVAEATKQGWIGAEVSERLLDRARAARRKFALRREAGEHSAAAWAKLMQFRDELREAHEEWIESWQEEERDHANENRMRRGSGPSSEIPFIPPYDDAPIEEEAADDRAWALLEPNVRYLLERLSPPRGARSRRDSDRERGRSER